MSEPKVSVEIVTVEKAERYLRQNAVNRPLKQDRVRQYARDMAEGRWAFNDSMIVFDTDGNLIQGQHRLNAILRAKIPLRTLVMRGAEPQAQLSMDTGVSRSAADQLGLVGMANAQKLAAAVTLVWQYKRGILRSASVRPSIAEIIEFAREHPELQASVTVAKRSEHILSAGMMGGLHYLFAKKDPKLADWFIQRLGDGEQLNKFDPVYVLRETLIRRKTARVMVPRATVIALVIKAWNAVREGKLIRQLQFQGEGKEQFPEIA